MTVLLIDDDEDFRHACAAMLREDGHTVQEYPRSDDVPPAILGDADVVVTDYQLPGQSGLTFAERVRGTHPTLPILLLTAYWSHHLEGEALGRGFLLRRKPIPYEELHTLIHAMGS
jgi:DNA-binding response OmpR family regulator